MKKVNSMVGAAYSDLLQTRKIMMTVIAVLAAANLFLVFMVATKSTTVVVTPPDYTKEVMIGDGAANEEYQKQFAYSIALLLGNIDKQNVGFVIDSMTKMLSPYLRNELVPALKREATLLELRDAAQQFVVTDMIFSPKNDLVWVWGEKRLAKKGAEPDVVRWTYEISVKPMNGQPRITHLRGYKGTPNIKSRDEIIEKPPVLTDEQNDLVSGAVALEKN